MGCTSWKMYAEFFIWLFSILYNYPHPYLSTYLSVVLHDEANLARSRKWPKISRFILRGWITFSESLVHQSFLTTQDGSVLRLLIRDSKSWLVCRPGIIFASVYSVFSQRKLWPRSFVLMAAKGWEGKTICRATVKNKERGAWGSE